MYMTEDSLHIIRTRFLTRVQCRNKYKVPSKSSASASYTRRHQRNTSALFFGTKYCQQHTICTGLKAIYLKFNQNNSISEHIVTLSNSGANSERQLKTQELVNEILNAMNVGGGTIES